MRLSQHNLVHAGAINARVKSPVNHTARFGSHRTPDFDPVLDKILQQPATGVVPRGKLLFHLDPETDRIGQQTPRYFISQQLALAVDHYREALAPFFTAYKKYKDATEQPADKPKTAISTDILFPLAFEPDVLQVFEDEKLADRFHLLEGALKQDPDLTPLGDRRQAEKVSPLDPALQSKIHYTAKAYYGLVKTLDNMMTTVAQRLEAKQLPAETLNPHRELMAETRKLSPAYWAHRGNANAVVSYVQRLENLLTPQPADRSRGIIATTRTMETGVPVSRAQVETVVAKEAEYSELQAETPLLAETRCMSPAMQRTRLSPPDPGRHILTALEGHPSQAEDVSQLASRLFAIVKPLAFFMAQGYDYAGIAGLRAAYHLAPGRMQPHPPVPLLPGLDERVRQAGPKPPGAKSTKS